ncbi:MAG: choice-of-anchor R domain-containing protein [Isosphaerales bacterium]
MKSRSCVVTMVALWGVVASQSARAGNLVVSNLGQSPSGADFIMPYDPSIGQFGFTAAQEFNTGSPATSLDRIFANIGNYDSGTNGDFQLTATLLADSAGTPSGSPLVSFTFNVGSIPTSGFANVEFDPVGTFNLAASTNYWFVLSGSSPSDGSGGVNWNYTDSTITSGPGSLPQFNNSYDGGATWNGPFSGGPYLVQVNGVLSVPEPAGWVLGSIGFAAVLGLARWSRSRRRDAGPAL